jgi:hypothetical protein
MKNILNIYIKRPLIWDILIVSFESYLVNIAITKLNLNISIKLELMKSILSDLVNSTISLGGFVLASLTIIVTFNDNLRNNSKEQKENGMSILFSSRHYSRIVGVFIWAVLIFLSLFVILSICKIFVEKFLPIHYVYLCIVPVSFIALTIFRTILILYYIIKLQLSSPNKINSY